MRRWKRWPRRLRRKRRWALSWGARAVLSGPRPEPWARLVRTEKSSSVGKFQTQRIEKCAAPTVRWFVFGNDPALADWGKVCRAAAAFQKGSQAEQETAEQGSSTVSETLPVQSVNHPPGLYLPLWHPLPPFFCKCGIERGYEDAC